MKSRTLCLFALACALNLQAQNPPAEQAAPAPSEPRNFVRRFSAGGTFSFLPISLMTGGTTSQTLTSPAVTIDTTGSSQSNWFSGGAAVQAALTERLALASNFLIRRPGYEIAATSTEDDVTTIRTEQTRATYWDIPLLVRRYSIGRHDPGFRWFYEGGGALRTVTNIRTQIETSTGGTITCCDVSPAVPAHRNVAGVVMGAGLYTMDDFGFQVIPEFRYTRWFQSTFDSPTAASRLNQIELMVSITF